MQRREKGALMEVSYPQYLFSFREMINQYAMASLLLQIADMGLIVECTVIE